jgi:Pectate lyase superfamily protein
MKQFLTCVLALAVILGAATAASERARAFLLSGRTQTVPAVGDEEFVGPFANWLNVKTTPGCGATGDGTTDDTTAIQSCLHMLGASTPVLFFPAGTYKISSALTLTSAISVSIVGADPTTTSIVWAGTSGNVMLYLDGVAYSKVDRITLNGQGVASYLIIQNWDGVNNYYPTGNEFADDIFENSANFAFYTGGPGGSSENAILRDSFINNVIGILPENPNSLDEWIWYSIFQNNHLGAGNYYAPSSYVGQGGVIRVYNSVFEGSTYADLTGANASLWSYRGNYSNGSCMFLYGGGGGGTNIFVVQGNTVLNPSCSATGPIRMGDPGPMILLDNAIQSTVAPAVTVGSTTLSYGELFSAGNTFTTSTAACGGAVTSYGRCHSINDQVVGSIPNNPPTLPGTPPNLGRTIYEVTTVSQINSGISSAGASCNNSVVHIQAGNYSVASTIQVPANCAIQIIGDGGNSLLTASGASPVLQLLGPSKVTLRDFQCSGNGNASDCIEVDSADQPGARVFMEGVILTQSRTNLFVDSLDYTLVEAHDFQNLSTELVSGTPTGVVVTGGTRAAAGNWQGGATNIFAGLAAANYYGWQTSGGAHLAVEDVWNDAGGTSSNQNSVFIATGIGTVTYSGGLLATSTGDRYLVLNNFTGVAGLVGNEVYCPNNSCASNNNVDITGTGSGASDLGLGLAGSNSGFFAAAGSPTYELVNPLYNPAPSVDHPSQASEANCCSTPFLTATLAQLRGTQPTVPGPLPAGVTDVRLYRVSVSSANSGIHLKH